MKYEQKLDLIVKALAEAKKATTGRGPTSLYLDANSGLDIFDEREVKDILQKLEVETRKIKLCQVTNRLLDLDKQPKNPGYILIDVYDSFDEWYERYLTPEQLDTKIVQTKDLSQFPWPDNFRWVDKEFVFGNYGKARFTSKNTRRIFEKLVEKKGGWATVAEMGGDKSGQYVRSTISQLFNRFPNEVKKLIQIISSLHDTVIEKPNTGSYRIKIIS